VDSKIFVVGHCFMVNDWQSKLETQLNKIVESGLYSKADEIFIYLTDEKREYFEIVGTLKKKYDKIQFNHGFKNYGEGILALNQVYDLSFKYEDAQILYFHTKGVFNKFKNFATHEIDELKTKSEDTWVEMLEYFLIENWSKCIEKLKTYNTVGVHCYAYWWWGNFWWTNAYYVRNNKPFMEFWGGSRWQCEAWLMEANKFKNDTKYYEFFHFCYDPHYTIMPKYFYDGTDLKNLRIELINSEYGYFNEQRDEGRSLPEKEKITIDVSDVVEEHLKKNNYNKLNLSNERFIDYEQIFKTDIAKNLPKKWRTYFRTNIDPEKIYVVSSFESFYLNLGNIK
jgi:hypothetical protein